MNYLIWRLHRNQVRIAVAALAALAAALLITGIRMAHQYHHFLASCGAAHSCGDASQLFSGDSAIAGLVYATWGVPLLFGMFCGAPLLAREFEDGTHSLAWTQGVTRRRWLGRNAGWAVLAAALWGAATAALVSWWHIPENALGIAGGRFFTGSFDIQGIVPVAYSVFAVTLGIAAGSVFRRVLPAIAATFAVFVAVRVAIALCVRPHYLSPSSGLISLTASSYAGPAGSWGLSSTVVGPDGRSYGSNFPPAGQAPAACRPGMSPSCLASHGFHMAVTYQPASRFWAFQGIEAGIFIILAAALVAVAYRMILTRDA